MDRMDHDINVLDKILNSPVLLGTYPFISHVHVYQFHKHIDVVIVFDYSKKDDFFFNRDNIHITISDLAKMAGVETKYKIHP